jgi:hypothetical protein
VLVIQRQQSPESEADTGLSPQNLLRPVAAPAVAPVAVGRWSNQPVKEGDARAIAMATTEHCETDRQAMQGKIQAIAPIQ